MLQDELRQRSGNVDLVKFAASILVILSHAFALSEGNTGREWFSILSKEQTTMGEFAVCIFFFYSGLLISKSLAKQPTAKVFFCKRLKRLVPALAVVSVLTAFVLGPVMTELPLGEYFSQAGAYQYLLNAVFIRFRYLPGVFAGNCSSPDINGSLWTLQVELLCYLGGFILFRMKMLGRRILLVFYAVLVVGSSVLFYTPIRSALGKFVFLILPAMMFYSGILFWQFRDLIQLRWSHFLAAVLVLVILNESKLLPIGLILTLPYILTFLGYMPPRVPKGIARLGEWSYGIYLCAYPIQQMIVAFFGGSMDPYLNMALAIPASVLVGWFVNWVAGRIIKTH